MPRDASTLPPDDLARLRAAVDGLGLKTAAQRLGISQITVARAASGAGVAGVTRLALAHALARLDCSDAH